jgi:hypothetical protein
MNALFFAGLLLVAADDQQKGRIDPYSGRAGPTATMLDGQWALVYGEREGQRLDKAGTTNVSIRANVLTFNMDGQEHNWRLDFGPHQNLRAWHEGEGARTNSGTFGARGNSGTDSSGTAKAGGRAVDSGGQRGVYILSGEYLCLSLEPMAQGRSPSTAGGTAGRGRDATSGRTEASGPTGTGVGSAVPGMAAPLQNDHFVMILRREGAASGRGR